MPSSALRTKKQSLIDLTGESSESEVESFYVLSDLEFEGGSRRAPSARLF